MRFMTLMTSARSRLLACLLTLIFVAAPTGGALASADPNDSADIEVYNVDDSPVLTGEALPGGTDNLDDEDDDGNPIDVDYIIALELFLVALRTVR